MLSFGSFLSFSFGVLEAYERFSHPVVLQRRLSFVYLVLGNWIHLRLDIGLDKLSKSLRFECPAFIQQCYEFINRYLVALVSFLRSKFQASSSFSRENRLINRIVKMHSSVLCSVSM